MVHGPDVLADHILLLGLSSLGSTEHPPGWKASSALLNTSAHGASPVTGCPPLPLRGRRAPAVGAIPRGSGRAGAVLSCEEILRGSSSEGGREAARGAPGCAPLRGWMPAALSPKRRCCSSCFFFQYRKLAQSNYSIPMGL